MWGFDYGVLEMLYIRHLGIVFYSIKKYALPFLFLLFFFRPLVFPFLVETKVKECINFPLKSSIWKKKKQQYEHNDQGPWHLAMIGETIGYTAIVLSGERNHTQPESSRTACLW